MPGVPAGAESFAPARRLGMLQDGTAVIVAARDGRIEATELRWGGTFGPLRTLSTPATSRSSPPPAGGCAVAYLVEGPADQGAG